MNVVCRACNTILSSHFTSSRNPKAQHRPRPFVVHEAVVMASLMSGMGPYSFNSFCEYMEMPGLHQKTFNKFAKRIYSQNERLGDRIFREAAALVRQEHMRQFHLNLDDDSLLDISVSFDGSWLTRGHKSLIGIGCVIDVLTGLIIDGHVMSLHCHVCARTGTWVKRETPQRYEHWLEEHVRSGECTVNFEGSSGMMEVQAAVVLWSRSA
ncbi:hypothetical protein PoB_003947200 [Plakobranchus ocellatus]|uniref:Mutator-like transposase domain-containing protein n=1 Tax=Plakobranchus ocellatus TaxID=259542 RepID=A0AAV4B0D5_9GAST|nr:hypothetical protein PoB_003947200 [Plakobranchus ocellatus]